MILKEILANASPSILPSVIAAVEQADAADLDLEASGRVFILRNFTIDLIEPFLKYRLYESGIRPALQFGDYDTICQELLNSNSPLYRDPPDITVVALMIERLDSSYGHPGWNADMVIEQVQDIFDMVGEKTGSMIAVNTFLPPFHREQGISTLKLATDCEREIRRLNDFVRDYVSNQASRFFLMDWERFLRVLGEERSIDYRYWYLSQAPFKSGFLDLYAVEISRLMRVIKGKSKKCLVLDCDNTLWGGVIGEEGTQGIQLDPNEWPGKAFYNFQKSLLCLAERGILITLCSKNNEQDVWDVLDNHQHCLLKRKHLAAWKINWDNKASNIASLAGDLNLGLDSFVFVEDDSAQCDLIRQAMPDVTVLQVPTQLYTYPDILVKSGLFDTLTLSEEDRQRTSLYQQERKRSTEKRSFSNIDDYLASLRMQANIHRATKHEISRVAQLMQKTNQFNLTTRRYSESDIEVYHKDTSTAIYTLSVKDRFGDLGLTGVLIAKREGDRGSIDSLLLSCRILGRDLENLFVDCCLKNLEKEWNIAEWEAEFIATRKNGQAAHFWDNLGFELHSETTGSKRYMISREARPRYSKSFIEVTEDQ